MPTVSVLMRYGRRKTTGKYMCNCKRFGVYSIILLLGLVHPTSAAEQLVKNARSVFILAPEWKAKADSLYPSGPEYFSLHRLLGSYYPLRADSLALRQLIENGQASLKKKRKLSGSSRRLELADKAASMSIKLPDTTLAIICDTIIVSGSPVSMDEAGALPPEKTFLLIGRVLGAQGGSFRLQIGRNSISGQLEFWRQPDEYRNSWRMRASHLFDIRYLGPPGVHSLVHSMNLED